MALKGIRVVEMAGLAPAPFCGMLLSDFGASVVRVDKASPVAVPDTLSRGKRSIAIDLKKPEGVGVLKKLCQQADVLIEPFRAGVMEKLGLGPSVLMQDNPRLVYARLTGFGQSGPLAPRAGHDINYLAISGVLSRLAWAGGKPQPPINLLADFAGGGLTCAFGIVMALLERSTSGRGQVIDANMVEGAAYVSSFLFNTRELGMWGEKVGTGWLDGGQPFYDTYETKDGGYMAVGAIEPQFYAELLKGLGLSDEEAPQFSDNPAAVRAVLAARFRSRTRAEWTRVFSGTDACVSPVLSDDEAARHEHGAARDSFFFPGAGAESGEQSYPEPKPAPKLSRTPGRQEVLPRPDPGQHTDEVLGEMGYGVEDVAKLKAQRVVLQATPNAKL